MHIQVYETGVGGGILLTRKNDTGKMLDTSYASFTAPVVVKCVVKIDGQIIDTIYAGAGGSHSWWTAAQGKLLPHGLKPDETLVITADGPAALRVDWLDQD